PFLAKPHLPKLEKPQLIRGVVGRVLQPTTEKIVPTGNIAADVFSRTGNECGDLIQQGRRTKFVGIDEQHPRISRSRVVQGPVSLLTEVLERMEECPDVRPGGTGALHSLVRAV